MHPIKIKASALQFAILVSVMVALLLGSFLTLSHTQRYFKIQSDFLLSNIEATNIGINEGLTTHLIVGDTVVLSEENTTIKVTKGFWGGFTKLSSLAETKSKKFGKLLLAGSMPTTPKTAAYIGDESLPLVLVGNARLEGTTYLSKNGIKAGNIAGHYYHGGPLVRGGIRLNAGGLPSIDKDWRQYIERISTDRPSNEDFIHPSDENNRSFFESTQYIYSPDLLVLTESYIGNIIIKSDREIRVTPYCRLTDVLLIAPKITLESGFNGTAHLIAKEKIELKENVSLTYPSSLVVLGKQYVDGQPLHNGDKPIVISNSAWVQGIVVYLQTKEGQTSKRDSRTHIKIESQGGIDGSLYCEGNLELEGTIRGSVYTQNFMANASGSRYMNHIYNGKVLGNDLHAQFAGLPLVLTHKKIAKWLY